MCMWMLPAVIEMQGSSGFAHVPMLHISKAGVCSCWRVTVCSSTQPWQDTFAVCSSPPAQLPISHSQVVVCIRILWVQGQGTLIQRNAFMYLQIHESQHLRWSSQDRLQHTPNTRPPDCQKHSNSSTMQMQIITLALQVAQSNATQCHGEVRGQGPHLPLCLHFSALVCQRHCQIAGHDCKIGVGS